MTEGAILVTAKTTDQTDYRIYSMKNNLEIFNNKFNLIVE